MTRSGSAVALVLVLAAAATWRSLHRVEVVGLSMAPALIPGDRLLVVGAPCGRPPWPAPGTVVALRDPRDPARLLVKRVTALRRRDETLEVAGDAPGASTDSRHFGPVPRSSVVGRAVYRYAPADRSGPGPWPAGYHRA